MASYSIQVNRNYVELPDGKMYYTGSVVLLTQTQYNLLIPRDFTSGVLTLLATIPDPSGGITGTGGGSITTTSGIASDLALTSAFTQITNPFEKMPMTAYGHSYMATSGGAGTTTGARWPERLATRLNTTALVNNAVSGTSLSEIASRVLATWTVPSRGLVVLMGTINSVQGLEGANTAAESLRVILASLSALAKFEESVFGFIFHGTWVAGPTTGISGTTSKRTTTVGDSVDVYCPTGGAITLISQMSLSSGGVITATRAGDGATVGTWNTSGFNPHTTPGPMVLTVTGQTPGTTIRFTLTSGTGFTVDGVLIPNTVNPPVILFELEGPINTYSGASAVNTTAVNNALLASYGVACDPIIAAFPNAVGAKATDNNWITNTYTTTIDGIHPNDLGQVFYTDMAYRTLMKTFGAGRDGLNLISVTASVALGQTGYYVGSPTVPDAPPSLTVTAANTSAILTVTVGGNGGAAVTDYVWQYRTTIGPGPWLSFAHTASPATSITITGLTTSVSYDFQAAAVNSAGTGAFSPIQTATPITTYAVDTFDRADGAMGTTSDGLFTWTAVAQHVIRSNQAAASSVVGTTSAFLVTGHADATITVTMSVFGDATLVGRWSADTAYWYVSPGVGAGGKYILGKKVGSTFTTVVTSTTTATVGDQIQLIFAGNVITAKINGVQVATTTDAYSNTNVGVGFRIADTTARFDNLIVTA